MDNDQIKDKAAFQAKLDKRAEALRANLKRRKEQGQTGPSAESPKKGG